MGLSIAAGVAFHDHAPGDAGGPPLLLVHGAGGSHLHWPEALRTLPGRRVIAVDLPGHGQAPRPGERSVAAYAGAVRGLLDALGIGRVVVAGHSMGGAVALTLALEDPDRVVGLLLVGTGCRLRVAPAVLAAAADPERAVEVADLVTRASFGAGASEETLRAHARALAATPRGVLHGDFEGCDGFDVTARLGEVRCPASVVVGSDDRLTPPKYATLLRERLPGHGMRVVPSAGHMVALEAPAEVAGAAEELLREVGG